VVTELPCISEQALKHYKEARRVYTVCFGIEHERVADSCLWVSHCNEMLGDPEGELEFLREAHRIYVNLGISSDASRVAAELISWHNEDDCLVH
jgi:hypothetical protein